MSDGKILVFAFDQNARRLYGQYLAGTGKTIMATGDEAVDLEGVESAFLVVSLRDSHVKRAMSLARALSGRAIPYVVFPLHPEIEGRDENLLWPYQWDNGENPDIGEYLLSLSQEKELELAV